MNEEHNTINQQREIVWVDGSGNLHNITKVVYSDPYRATHTIWPCTIELRDVQIVKLSKNGQASDVAYEYHVDTNTLMPNVSLIPGEVYSVKGTVDVYSRPGELEKRIKNCYFFPETISSSLDPESHPFLAPTGNEAYSYGSRTAKAYDVNDNYLGEDYVSDYSQYVMWGVTSDIEKTGRIELQGGWYNERFGYVQNGYIFDGNYATRMIFRRATLAQDIVLSKISGNNISSSDVINSPILLDSDQTITFWPKLYKRVSDSTAAEAWEEYSDIDLSIEDFTYDSSVLNIYKNQNNSWTIEPLAFSNQPSVVTITYGNVTREFNVIVSSSSMFMLMLTANTPVESPLKINKATTISIRESTDGGMTWNLWSGSDYINRTYSFTSNDSSIISVSGTTLTPNVNKVGQSTTVDVVIENQNVATITVEVEQAEHIYTYYKAGPLVNGTINSAYVNELQSTNTVTWVSPAQGDLFGIQFFIDSSGNTVREIYCDGINTAPFYGNYSGGIISIAYTSGSATSVNIPIYTDSTKTTLLGTITLNKVS